MGLLPVRDCSCRGDTGAGYAHLSCLVQYAQTKSTEILNKPSLSHNNCFIPWRICPNCEQKYQHDLALDLANSMLEFVEKMYPELNTPEAYLSMNRSSLYGLNGERRF